MSSAEATRTVALLQRKSTPCEHWQGSGTALGRARANQGSKCLGSAFKRFRVSAFSEMMGKGFRVHCLAGSRRLPPESGCARCRRPLCTSLRALRDRRRPASPVSTPPPPCAITNCILASVGIGISRCPRLLPSPKPPRPSTLYRLLDNFWCVGPAHNSQFCQGRRSENA